MLFNSLNFLLFLLLVVVVYYIFPQRIRWIWLLFSSLYFYTSWDAGPVLVLLTVTLISYTCALGLRFNRGYKNVFLILGILANLGFLVTFKYLEFFSDQLSNFSLTQYLDAPRLNLPLPIGLSFYTFSAISYLVDVHRGQLDAEKHLGRFAVYVAFFPKLFAGPIERARTFLPQLNVRVQIEQKMVT